MGLRFLLSPTRIATYASVLDSLVRIPGHSSVIYIFVPSKQNSPSDHRRFTFRSSTNFVIQLCLKMTHHKIRRYNVLIKQLYIERLLQYILNLPGTNIRVGLDPLLGLLPIVGDSISGILSLYLVYYAYCHEADIYLLGHMLTNAATDWVVGLVPFVGDWLDIINHSNMRNLALLQDFLEAKRRNADRIDDRNCTYDDEDGGSASECGTTGLYRRYATPNTRTNVFSTNNIFPEEVDQAACRDSKASSSEVCVPANLNSNSQSPPSLSSASASKLNSPTSSFITSVAGLDLVSNVVTEWTLRACVLCVALLCIGVVSVISYELYFNLQVVYYNWIHTYE